MAAFSDHTGLHPHNTMMLAGLGSWSEVMASGFLSCFMIMVTNYFEILQEEKWLGYGPSIQWAKNGEIGRSIKKNSCLLFFLVLFWLKRNSPIFSEAVCTF